MNSRAEIRGQKTWEVSIRDQMYSNSSVKSNVMILTEENEEPGRVSEGWTKRTLMMIGNDNGRQ